MITVFRKIAIITLLLLLPSAIFAQSIVVDAIEINFPTSTGEAQLPTYSDFIGNTKNPILFRTQNISELSRNNSFVKTGFEIDFIFRLKNTPKHQFIGGFEAATINSDLYEISGLFQDSLTASTTLKTKTEYFFLKSGYNYVRTPSNKFTIMGGVLVNFGIPISAKTNELISTNDTSFEELEYSFFAKQSASFGLNIPFGFRFKVINNFSLSFTINPGFQYLRIDGNPVFTTFQGANLSFHFKLREK